MPDNIPITPGLGVSVATDQDAVTGAHYQRVKLMDGTEASSDPIVSDGKSSLRVRTANEDMLKDGNASVKVVNDQTQPVPVQLDRYGRSLSGNAIPVVLATDHDAVPVTSSSLPMIGGALGANGATFGPIPLVGCNGVLVQLSGTYNLTVIFEATVLDPTTGPWVSVNGTRTNNGQIDTNPAVNSLNAAWDFFLAGFTYFRIRVTAFTSGLAQFQVARYTNAQDPTPSVVAQGAAAAGTAVTGNPVLVAGSDGANARNLSTDATGRAVVAGGAAVGAAVAGNPIFVAGADGASTGYARQPTVTPPNTAVNGQTTNQPTVLLIGGVDGVYTVSPSQAAPNLNPVGTARALLTVNAGVLQVSDSSISLLRQELRETNALLLMILQTLAGNDMVTGKDGLMPHQVPVQ